jgi:hypothetical protein
MSSSPTLSSPHPASSESAYERALTHLRVCTEASLGAGANAVGAAASVTRLQEVLLALSAHDPKYYETHLAISKAETAAAKAETILAKADAAVVDARAVMTDAKASMGESRSCIHGALLKAPPPAGKAESLLAVSPMEFIGIVGNYAIDNYQLPVSLI